MAARTTGRAGRVIVTSLVGGPGTTRQPIIPSPGAVSGRASDRLCRRCPNALASRHLPFLEPSGRRPTVLRELHVRNLAVIAGASVELGPGFNVLTGETGAGKSMVVDALLLLAGARATADLVRTGADGLTVTGLFEPAGQAWRGVLAAAGVDGEGPELLVRREVSREGRNRVYVNDQPATARLLTDLAPHLLRIHGQREEMGLVDPELQRVWLDRSGGVAARDLLVRTAAAWEDHHRLALRLERLAGDDRARRERADLLRFQAQEIDAARLVAGEEVELAAERDVLRNVEDITRALGTASDLLFEDEGAAGERIARSQGLLDEVAAWEPAAGEWNAELEDVRIRLEEVARAVRRRLEGLEADPARLDAVESRLSVVERLCRKFGGTTESVLARRAAIGRELDELEDDAADRDTLEERAATALAAYREAALALSAARADWGAALVERLAAELADLGLGKARLAVSLERRPAAGAPLVLDGRAVETGPHGIDRVVLLFAPNPGEEPRPLARIASGGELSRIYLALQLAVRDGDDGEARPTLVFDEVDVGVSGAQAAALGGKLQRLGGRHQILAVTHLAQVASHADHHFRISKEVVEGRTRTAVEPLGTAERVEEIARLLAGHEVTDLSLSHAREMISGAARAGA